VRNVLIRHTAELDDAALAAVRALCDKAFEGDFSDADWEHALGGVHALGYEDDRLVAHAALVARRLLHADRALRTGYVEAVAVAADRRRRGHGAAVMRALDPYLAGGYVLGALATTDDGAPLYVALGWSRWPGPTAVLTPDGIRPTPDACGAIFVRTVGATLDPEQPLICDWRDGDVW
jgi:aminoglycoside 2'-N-acetyltransferase I